MKNLAFLALLPLLPLLSFLCNSLIGAAETQPSGNLTFRDPSGAVVATGDLLLPDPLPASGKTFEGTWQLKSAEKSFPSGAVKSGKYAASVHEGGVTINLNPGTADNNVMLNGTMSNGMFSGKWSLSTFVGGKEKGTFTVTAAGGGAGGAGAGAGAGGDGH